MEQHQSPRLSLLSGHPQPEEEPDNDTSPSGDESYGGGDLNANGDGPRKKPRLLSVS